MRRRHVNVGLTPAYAGTTTTYPTRGHEPWAYPRIRGDDVGYRLGPRSLSGLPPHTRGRRRTDWCHCRDRGLTPAYAGTTASRARWSTKTRAYPRIRGDDKAWAVSALFKRGLPPHTRGRPALPVEVSSRGGFTPAYVGGTARSPPPARRRSDYPRVRGEDVPRE
mgnify:CR=1 FL=1